MDNPTTLADLLPYLLHLVAPYLISGPILSHALEQIPFFLDPPDDAHPEGKYPDWLQISAVYLICLFLVIVNGVLSGAYATGLTGDLIRTTFANATAFMAMVTLPHLAVNQFLPSIATFLSGLFAGVIAAISSIIHPPPTVTATDQLTGQVLTGILESAKG